MTKCRKKVVECIFWGKLDGVDLEEFKKIVTDLKKLAIAYFGLLLLC